MYLKIKNNEDLWKLFGVKRTDVASKLDLAYLRLKKENKYEINDLRLAWKILRDPFLSKTYFAYKSIKSVIEAGFFDDGLEPGSLTKLDFHNWLCTPFQKISDNLQRHKKDKRFHPVVLFSTGGFSPVHTGHIEMMKLAKLEVEKLNKTVVGGYISPSHDEYVWNKYTDSLNLDSSSRIDLCEKAIRDSDWLMIDTWEARYNKVPITYTDAILRLEGYLQFHLGLKIEVVYVFGSDNAVFSRAFIDKGSCVCVKREGYESKLEDVAREVPIAKPKNIIFTSQSRTKPSISSSELRKKISFQNFYKSDDSLKKIYAVRNDGLWALEKLSKSHGEQKVLEAKRGFLNDFVYYLQAIFSKDSIVVVNLKSQQNFINVLNKSKKVINMDVCTNGGYRLYVSRLFDICDGQLEPRAVIGRLGYPLVDKQISDIPSGTYVLVDDDVATGYTGGKVLSLLPRRIKIESTLKLLHEDLKTGKYVPGKSFNLIDVVDLRDFIIGSKDSGLVVTLPDGEICRVPYLLPYVSLRSRAMIPPTEELEFSIKLWRLNVGFYKSLEKPVLLSQ